MLTPITCSGSPWLHRANWRSCFKRQYGVMYAVLDSRPR